MIAYHTALLNDTKASAAVEMALVLPILLTLMFGSMELGNYFLDNHVVAKGVRDGARYAARLPIDNYNCPSGSAAGSLSANENTIQEVTRTGKPDGTGTPRLGYWTESDTVSITVSCAPVSTYPGIYSTLPGDVPVVTVSATISYNSLFGRMGWTIGQGGPSVSSINITAKSQAAVMGI